MSSQPQEKPRLGVVPQQKPGKPLRILVVNADDNVSTVLRQGFQPIGSVLLDIASDAETATRMLSTEPYDLVAVDPAQTLGGFVLLKHIKKHFRWTATLLATHNQDPQFLRQAVKCQIDGLLFRKPEVFTEFIEQCLLLAKAVAARRRRQQKRVLAIGAHPDDVEIG
jgi:DNA-binding NtrC family response regulator